MSTAHLAIRTLAVLVEPQFVGINLGLLHCLDLPGLRSTRWQSPRFRFRCGGFCRWGADVCYMTIFAQITCCATCRTPRR